MTDRRQRLARLERQLAAAAFPELHSKGLAALLPYLTDDGAGDADGAYIDCAGAPGLRGLLFYQSPQGAG